MPEQPHKQPALSTLKFGCGTPVAEHSGQLWHACMMFNTVDSLNGLWHIGPSELDKDLRVIWGRSALALASCFTSEKAAWQWLLQVAQFREEVCHGNINRLNFAEGKP